MSTDARSIGRHRVSGAWVGILGRSALLAAATGTGALWAGDRVMNTPVPHTPTDALLYGAECLLAGSLAWLTVLLLLTAASTLPGRLGRSAHRALGALAPRAVGAVMATLLGAGIGAPGLLGTVQLSTPAVAAAQAEHARTDVLTGTASSAPTTGSDAAGLAFADRTGETVPIPGWTPPTPAPRPVRAEARLLGAGSTATRTPEVSVRAGDTLWDIVARHLGDEATAQRVLAELPRWHEANRSVIGPDMNLLLPGQVLVAPTTD